MIWTGCSTLSHNKYCDNSVIDGVLESSLMVTIYHKLLCIRVCDFKNQAWILFEDNVNMLQSKGVKSVLLAVCRQLNCYIFNRV